jgi:hypothetical protein
MSKHPDCLLQVVVESCEHGVGVPEHVPELEDDQLHPFVDRQVVLLVFDAHVVGVPVQAPVPDDQ